MGKYKLSKRKLRKLEREGRLRDCWELKLDRHNHKLELLRTVGNLVSSILAICVFLKVFGLV